MTYGSLFSGVGGIDLGLDAAGFRPAFHVEKDAKCLSVLRRHWPDVPKFKNVRDFHATSATVRPRLLCGGFPCQDLSVAGRRAGLDGERSGLFREFARIIGEFTPVWILLENVPGMLSGCGCALCRLVANRLEAHRCSGRRPCDCGECCVGKRLREAHSGRNFQIILATLVELGYGVAWRILDARWFGVPQRRKRVFVVGCFGGNVRRAAEVLFEPGRVPWHLAPVREAGPRVAAGLTSGVGSGRGRPAGRRREDDVNLIPVQDVHGRRGKQRDRDGLGIGNAGDPMFCSQAKHQHGIAYTLGAEGFEASEDGTGRGTPLVPAAYQCQGSAVGPMGTIMGDDVTRGVPFVFQQRSGRNGRAQPSDVAPSLTGSEAGETCDSRPCVVTGMAVRRLMPIETERLMGWPDDHTAWGVDESGKRVEMSDSVRYRMCGNGVVASVAEWIGKRILETGR